MELDYFPIKNRRIVTSNLLGFFFLFEDVIKSATFFSTSCPFPETFLCALETLGLACS